jgi:hypothetical protein
MDRGNALRKLVHVSAPLFLIYYSVPNPMWEGGPPKQTVLLLVLVATLVFELLRLVLNFKVTGMRGYEAEQISAGAWAGIGLTFAFLFFPLEYAAPAVLGMAFIDPLNAYTRKNHRRLYPSVPLVIYFILALVTMSLLMPFSSTVVLASLVAAVLGMAAEGYKTRYVDDDFLMIAIPLVGIALVFSAIP